MGPPSQESAVLPPAQKPSVPEPTELTQKIPEKGAIATSPAKRAAPVMVATARQENSPPTPQKTSKTTANVKCRKTEPEWIFMIKDEKLRDVVVSVSSNPDQLSAVLGCINLKDMDNDVILMFGEEAIWKAVNGSARKTLLLKMREQKRNRAGGP